MKGIILASLLVLTVSAGLLEEDGVHFQSFKLKHGKTYRNQAEEIKRFAIFRENLRNIEAHNAEYEQGFHTYTQAVNQFADMTPAEFRAKLTTQLKSKSVIVANKTFESAEGDAVPDFIDWKEKNAVTPIKDQGNCGSCYAFSVVGSTEGAYALSTGELREFSAQELVDCSTNVNFGCDGGYLDKTFPIIKTYGLQLESDYPYVGGKRRCAYDSTKVVTKISSYVSVASNEESLRQAVGTVGPVSIGINGDYIQFYSSGIFSNPKCDPLYLDHAVLAVGYGTENDQDYWIVKNSWGTQWGESGYLKLLRGQNVCGVKESAFYPII